ncbi:MAG: hypothetical protein WBR26_01770 [Candidatus Acidiferrum sp.]
MKRFYINHRDGEIGEMDEFNAGQFVQAQVGTPPVTLVDESIAQAGPTDRAEREGEVRLEYDDMYGKPCWTTIRYVGNS